MSENIEKSGNRIDHSTGTGPCNFRNCPRPSEISCNITDSAGEMWDGIVLVHPHVF